MACSVISISRASSARPCLPRSSRFVRWHEGRELRDRQVHAQLGTVSIAHQPGEGRRGRFEDGITQLQTESGSLDEVKEHGRTQQPELGWFRPRQGLQTHQPARPGLDDRLEVGDDLPVAEADHELVDQASPFNGGPPPFDHQAARRATPRQLDVVHCQVGISEDPSNGRVVACQRHAHARPNSDEADVSG